MSERTKVYAVWEMAGGGWEPALLSLFATREAAEAYAADHAREFSAPCHVEEQPIHDTPQSANPWLYEQPTPDEEAR